MNDIEDFVAAMATVRFERDRAVPPAKLALDELVKVCANKTDQSYKIRALLYSLWNGKPRSLLEILSLDWELRKHLLSVLKAFGHDAFFYKQIRDAFQQRGLLDWFLQEGDKDL